MKKLTQHLSTTEGKVIAVGSLLGLSTVSSAAVPTEVNTLFTNLGTDTATLLGLAAVLFAAIRGGQAILKISARFFGAAGA